LVARRAIEQARLLAVVVAVAMGLKTVLELALVVVHLEAVEAVA
jgi:hypothetical protein